MSEILLKLVSVAVLVFAVSSMASVGFGHDWREIVEPLRERWKVVRALVVNFVLVPLLGLLILQVLPLERPHAVGIFLIATAAGAPFLIKLAQTGQSDVALSATLLLLLLPATILYMPVVVPLALPDARVSPVAIARPLLFAMLLPLAVGMVVRVYRQSWATRLQPIMNRISTAMIIMITVAQVLADYPTIAEILVTPAIVAALVLIAGAFLIGYGLGGPARESKEILGLGTSQRNIAAATVVATQAVGDPDTVSMVIVASLAGFVVLLPAAAYMRRRNGPVVDPGKEPAD